MSKTREQKSDMLAALTQKVKDAKSLVFVKFDKLTMVEGEELRRKLKKENSEYLTSKKTLLNIALKENNLKVDARGLEGQVGTIFGYEDEVAPAKTVSAFIKEHAEKMTFSGGVLEGKFLNASEVAELAKLPSKQELYAKVVGSINAPISGFVNALAGNLRNFVYVLKAIEEKKS